MERSRRVKLDGGAALLVLSLVLFLSMALAAPAAGMRALAEPTRTISGTVTDEAGNPLEGVTVSAASDYPVQAGETAVTAADGTYTIGGLSPDKYFVRTSNDQGYLDEIYWDVDQLSYVKLSGIAIPRLEGSLETANVLEADATGIDFQLALGRSISGTVTDEGGTPLEGVEVEAVGEVGRGMRTAFTAADGTYTIEVLPVGLYKVRTALSFGGAGEWYGGLLIAEYASGFYAPRVDLSGGDATGIDLQLGFLGDTYSGTVTDEGGVPIEGVTMELCYAADGSSYVRRSTLTTADGTYVMRYVPPGWHMMRTSGKRDYLHEWYDNNPIGENWRGDGVATLSGTTGIDFQLGPCPKISGTVTDEGGAPLEAARVFVYSEAGELRYSELTAADGAYSIDLRVYARYKVCAKAAESCVQEWYGGTYCLSDPDGAGATLVDATTGEASGIDFQLDFGPVVCGTVTDEGGVPIEGVRIAVIPEWRPGIVTLHTVSALTAADGTYSVRQQGFCSYGAETHNSMGYLDESYATPVDATAGDVAGVDFQLAVGPFISGLVTDEGGTPLAGVGVRVCNKAGTIVDRGVSGADGAYTVRVESLQSYRLLTNNNLGYVDEWYGDVPLLDDSAGRSAALVDVAAGGAADIDFRLAVSPCISGTVTDDAGVPIRGVTVYAGRLSALTSADGTYTIALARPGSCLVWTSNRRGYVDEWHGPGHLVKVGNNNGVGAQIVEVPLAGVSAIDFDLLRGYMICGNLSGGDKVSIYGQAGELLTTCGPPFMSAFYHSPSLPPGTYYVKAEAPTIWRMRPEWYDNKHSASHDIGEADPVVLVDADMNQIDFILESYAVASTTLRGTDRYDTAIKISQAMFPGALPAGAGLVLAPGETFPEALCGGPLAAAYGGPVLLTPKTGLNNAVRAELQRLQPTYVVCIGFYDGVRNAVQAALPGATVSVIRGITANQMSYKVALALKAKLGSLSSATAIITRGDKFADAIAVSPLACANKWPILLTGPSVTNSLSIYATQALGVCGIKKAIKVGTYVQLPAGVTGLANLSGVDRYQTNCNVAEWGKSNAGLRFVHLGIATGDKFPDALAAGPYLALDQGILLLSPPTGLPSVIAAEIRAKSAKMVPERVSFIAVVEPVVSQVRSELLR